MFLLTTTILLTTCLSLTSSYPSQSQSKLKLNSKTPNLCTTLSGEKCLFPFTYLGVDHFQCTYAQSPTPWCATEVDSNSTVVTNK